MDPASGAMEGKTGMNFDQLFPIRRKSNNSCEERNPNQVFKDLKAKQVKHKIGNRHKLIITPQLVTTTTKLIAERRETMPKDPKIEEIAVSPKVAFSREKLWRRKLGAGGVSDYDSTKPEEAEHARRIDAEGIINALGALGYPQLRD